MFAVQYNALQKNMSDCFDKVNSNCETMVVTRDEGNFVIMTEDAYNSLLENVYIYSSRANYEWLMQSKSQLENGNFAKHDLIDFE